MKLKLCFFYGFMAVWKVNIFRSSFADTYIFVPSFLLLIFYCNANICYISLCSAKCRNTERIPNNIDKIPGSCFLKIGSFLCRNHKGLYVFFFNIIFAFVKSHKYSCFLSAKLQHIVVEYALENEQKKSWMKNV